MALARRVRTGADRGTNGVTRATLPTWIPRGRLAKGTLAVMLWQGARLAALGAWVVVVARTLGANEYGVFAGLAGLAASIAGFSGMGIGYLLYQQVAIEPGNFGAYWRKTRIAYSITGGLLGACLIAMAALMFPTVTIRFSALVALSEVVAMPFVSAAAYAFAAHERMGWSSALPAMGAMLRLAALAAFVWSGQSGIEAYLWFHVAAAMAAALLSLLAVRRLLKPPRVQSSLDWRDLRSGSAFSVVWFSGTSLTSWDKALVLRLAGAEASGVYSAAYRIASMVAMPVDALVMAATPRLFRHRKQGGSDGGLLRYAACAVLAYGVAAGVLVACLAPVLTWMLGAGFESAEGIIRGISLMIPLYGMRQLGGHILVTHDRRRVRALIDLFGLGLMTALAFLLIPGSGVQGGVEMIVATEAALVVLVWAAAIATVRPLKRSTPTN